MIHRVRQETRLNRLPDFNSRGISTLLNDGDLVNVYQAACHVAGCE